MSATHSRILLTLLALVLVVGIATVPQPTHADGPWYVSNDGTDSNDCLSSLSTCATISGALDKAASGDTVYVATGTYTSTGSVEVVPVNKSVTLSGGWDAGFSVQDGRSVIDGNNERRAMTIGSGITVTIDHFGFQHGYADRYGGGIYNQAILTVNNSVINENTADLYGGGIYNDLGEVVLNSTAVYSNTSSWSGGGIHNRGALSLDNSTISGNSCCLSGSGGGGGGGIYNVGTVVLKSCTITNNKILSTFEGSGIYGSTGPVTMENTIIAGNTPSSYYAKECYGSAIQSLGYSLIGNPSYCNMTFSSSDVTDVDPKMGKLQDNGGSTLTHALLPESPAIHAGNPAGCVDHLGVPILSDQRGAPRLGRCDIGAYEAYEANLVATKQVEGQFRPTGVVTYTIRLNNQTGSIDLPNVELVDALPDEVTYIDGSLSTTGGTGVLSGTSVAWQGTVYSDTETVISFAALINDTTPLGVVVTNTAVITWGNWITVTTSASAVFDTYPRVYLPLCARNYCPDFFDDFSSPASGWPEGEDSYVRTEYLNGEYRVLSKQAGYIYLFRAPTCDRENYTVEVDARWSGTPSNSYGIIFGVASDFSHYYLFDMNTDYQMFRLYRRSPSGFTQIVAPTSSGAINGGTSSNHIKATRVGSSITLEVNGVVLGTWSDSAISGLTGVGLVSSPYSDSPTSDARFDNFSVTSNVDGATQVPSQAEARSPELDSASLPLESEFTAMDWYAVESMDTGWLPAQEERTSPSLEAIAPSVFFCVAAFVGSYRAVERRLVPLRERDDKAPD